MKIITIPHPTLRQKAQPVTVVDKKLKQFISELEETLLATTKPKGVGLAAPQVDRLRRIFALNLDRNGKAIRSVINPVITSHSEEVTLGPDPEEPYLEGCLSIPGIYGPVPRWQWVELEFQVIEDDRLVSKSEQFDDFAARVVQHEFDHLDGILFIDHSMKYNLPLYKENTETKKMEEFDRSLLQLV